MDAAALLDQLDPNAITARLEALRGEQKALRVLLRAARARSKSAGKTGGATMTPNDLQAAPSDVRAAR
jgi:hypothetical protein